MIPCKFGKTWVMLQVGLGSSPPALFNLPPAHTNVAEEAAVDASDGKQFVAEKVVEQISVVETDADIHGIFYKICFA